MSPLGGREGHEGQSPPPLRGPEQPRLGLREGKNILGGWEGRILLSRFYFCCGSSITTKKTTETCVQKLAVYQQTQMLAFCAQIALGNTD